jgi:lysophospholipase L1-like esterase
MARDAGNGSTVYIGRSPYIGANGNWYEWDDTAKAFIDTGVKAQGNSPTADLSALGLIITGTTIQLKNGNENLGEPQSLPITSSTAYTHIDRNFVLMGDSLTDIADQGQWVKAMMKEMTFKSLTNYAVSAATWLNKSDTAYDLSGARNGDSPNNVIWNQYNRLMRDIGNKTVLPPDAILIMGGGNDTRHPGASFGTVEEALALTDIGNIPPNTLVTTLSAMRQIIELIQINIPSATIIICSSTARTTYNDMMAELVPLIKSLCESLSIVFVDVFHNSGINYYREVQYPYYLKDGTHQNDIGGEKVYRYIMGSIYNLLRFSMNVNTISTVNKTALSSAITSATSNRDSVDISVDGTDVYSNAQWTTQAAYNTYSSAILTAQNVFNDSTATQSNVDDAVTTLSSATTTFNNAKAYGTLTSVNKTDLLSSINSANTNLGSVVISVNGSDIATTIQWVTQANRDSYNTAITSAQSVYDNSSATQTNVDNAITSLASATTTFNNSKTYGTLSAGPTPRIDIDFTTASYADTSGNGNTVNVISGTNFGGVNTLTPNGMLLTDSQHGIQVMNNEFASQSDYTYELLVQINTVSSNTITLIAKIAASDSMSTDGSILYAQSKLFFSTKVNSSTLEDLVSPSSPLANTVYHVVCTFNNSTREKKMYIDGVLVASAITPTYVFYGSNIVRIGMLNNTTSVLYKKFRYYDSVLTQSEITDRYNASL